MYTCPDYDYATAYLRCYVRVCRLSYHTLDALNHRGVDNHELVNLFYRNLTSIPFSLSSAHIFIVDKEEDCNHDLECCHGVSE